MPPTWIAEEPVVFVHPSGQRQLGRIAVGLPVEIDAEEATCPVALEGLDTIAGPIHGGSTLQALLLAVQFLGMRLHDFIAKGGRVLYPDGEADVPLHALFGPLLREATAVPGASAPDEAD